MDDQIRFAISKFTKKELNQYEIFNKLHELKLVDDINVTMSKKILLETLFKLEEDYSISIKHGVLYITVNRCL
jgi:accessory gene regulator protein AgrB